jgi:hypothetical protein
LIKVNEISVSKKKDKVMAIRNFSSFINERTGKRKIVLMDAASAKSNPFQKLFLETIIRVISSVIKIDGCPFPKANLGRNAEKKIILKVRNVVSKYFLLNFLLNNKQRIKPEAMFKVVTKILASANFKKEKGK